MRIIDADALKEAMYQNGGCGICSVYVDHATTIDAIPVGWLVNLKNEYAREGREQAEGDLMNLLLMWQKKQEAQDG